MPEYTILNNPIDSGEIEIAVSTAGWRMANDRRAERAGASLVSFWALVVLVRYIAHIVSGRLPRSWLVRYMTWTPVRRVRASVLNAPLGRRHHSEPWLQNLGIRLPTRSTTIILLLFAAMNYALIFSDYPFTDLNFIYTTHSQQWNKSLAIRCAFVIMWKLPLVFCFAGRNNVFLLVGHPWSLDTFNTFHKWIARMTIVDIFIHGIAISLVKAEQHLYVYVWSVEYWQWGVTGAITAGIVLVQSMHWISRNHYEVFKAVHTLLVVVFVVATWYHVKVLPYGMKHAYAIVAIWCFDWVCRLLRIALAGRVTAHLQHHTADVMTITISQPRSYDFARTSQSAFVFLHLPPFYMSWQSHPFTIMRGIKAGPELVNSRFNSDSRISSDSPTNSNSRANSRTNSDSQTKSVSHEEKQGGILGPTSASFAEEDALTGELIIGIKAQTGITRRLAQMEDGPLSMAIDGPYGTFFPLQRFDQVICIAGGIGITAHLSYIQYLVKNFRNKCIKIKLFWAVSNINEYTWVLDVLESFSAFVTVEIYSKEGRSVDTLSEAGSSMISYGRLCTQQILETEVSIINSSETPAQLTTAVFACGPGSLNDDARLAACWAIEHAHTFVDYFEDSFSW